MTDVILEEQLHIISMQAFPFEEYVLCESSTPGASIWKALRTYLDKLITMVKGAVQKVQSKIRKRVQTKHVDKQLKTLRKQVANMKTSTMKFYNVWEYEKIVKSTMGKLNRSLGFYMRRLNMVGAGLRATDKEIDRIERIIKEADEKLGKLRGKKIEVPTQKVLAWIDKQIKQGNQELFDFADDYLKKVEECKKQIKELDERAAAYADKTGMIRRPEGFKQVFHNSTRFVVRNVDWIGSAILMVTLTIVDMNTEETADNAVKKDSEDKKIFDRGDSYLYSKQRVDAYNAAKRRESRSSNKKAMQRGNVARNWKDRATGLTTATLGNAIFTKRNSV